MAVQPDGVATTTQFVVWKNTMDTDSENDPFFLLSANSARLRACFVLPYPPCPALRYPILSFSICFQCGHPPLSSTLPAIRLRFQLGREAVRVVQRAQRAAPILRASYDRHPREECHKRDGFRRAEHTGGTFRFFVGWFGFVLIRFASARSGSV